MYLVTIFLQIRILIYLLDDLSEMKCQTLQGFVSFLRGLLKGKKKVIPEYLSRYS